MSKDKKYKIFQAVRYMYCLIITHNVSIKDKEYARKLRDDIYDYINIKGLIVK